MADYQALRQDVDNLERTVNSLSTGERFTDFKESMRSELRGMEKQLEANAQLMQGLTETVTLNIQQQTKMLEQQAEEQHRRHMALEREINRLSDYLASHNVRLETKTTTLETKIDNARFYTLSLIGAVGVVLVAIEFLAR